MRGRPQLAPLSFSDRSDDVQELLVSATIQRVAQAFETLDDLPVAKGVREMPAIFAELESDWDEARLERLAARYDAQGRAWAHGRALFQLGVLRLERGEPASAQTFLEGALARLQEHRGEVRELEIRAWRARAFRECGRLADALREAEKAVALDPLSEIREDELGRVYEALGEWLKARDRIRRGATPVPRRPAAALPRRPRDVAPRVRQPRGRQAGGFDDRAEPFRQ